MIYCINKSPLRDINIATVTGLPYKFILLESKVRPEDGI